jgi:hypothetical protein
MHTRNLPMKTQYARYWSKSTTINEAGMLAFLRQGPGYPPAHLQLLNDLSASVAQPDRTTRERCDAVVQLSWRDQTVRYALEIKSSSSRAVVEQAMLQIQWTAHRLNLLPMILVPYLDEESLLFLQNEQVSGIDCSGNCVILGPSVAIWRSGEPNLFRDSRPIRNPYSGDSSIIARSFLLRNAFRSLDELRRFALGRTQLIEPTKTPLHIGTVSKVVSALESEIIVTRSPKGILMSNSRRLLDRLRAQYRPGDTPRLLGRTKFSSDEIWLRSTGRGADTAGRIAATGMASASRYGVLSGVERLSLYVDDLAAASELLEVVEGRGFANIELVEARNNLPFFDCRREGGALWASPIQTWLELAQGTAREQEAAQNLEQQLAEGRAETMI